mmetsp:Transcript_49798/g.50628  ORF Transcript_49798/g.50628 Transcript_49798/m.50628 type:complete len:104 (+) Transcript_49798:131-442(+)
MTTTTGNDHENDGIIYSPRLHNPSRTTSSKNQTSFSSLGTIRSVSSGTSVSTTTLVGEDVHERHPTDMLLSWWWNTSDAEISGCSHISCAEQVDGVVGVRCRP